MGGSACRATRADGALLLSSVASLASFFLPPSRHQFRDGNPSLLLFLPPVHDPGSEPLHNPFIAKLLVAQQDGKS